ncbi:D-lactate dehydrogenase [Vigna angularis]|uniref:D-lactate dehydrogenase n=1 Tax=Phaseolus angularis TaxID=3914 RepID=A0A8T0L258_PHAAN|nr:D-lactate dehydrogenase [Vigna angularis]
MSNALPLHPIVRNFNVDYPLHFDDMNVVVEPAIGWMELNEYLEPYGLFFPLDPVGVRHLSLIVGFILRNKTKSLSIDSVTTSTIDGTRMHDFPHRTGLGQRRALAMVLTWTGFPSDHNNSNALTSSSDGVSGGAASSHTVVLPLK